jgi:hypothetical protein
VLRFQTVPARLPLHRIAIYGQYKTGTTGVFLALRRELPEATRTLFEAPAYAPEPEDTGRSILAKVILGLPGPGWDVDYASFRGFGRHVYIVRDPRDWVVSGLLFLVQQERAIWADDRNLGEVLALLEQKEEDPRSLPASAILRRIAALGAGRSLEELTAWMGEQSRWLVEFERSLADPHRLRYEDFVDGRLDGLGQYLGFPVRPGAEVPPEYDHVPRTRSHGDWRNWFLPEDVAIFRPVFEPYMRHYGYGDDWTPSPQPVVRREHCTAYLRRVVGRRREKMTA